MKKMIIASFLVICFALPAFAVDWQTNPVFLRGIDKNTVFSSYSGTFGGGDLHNRSGAVGLSPYGFYLTADKKIYGHGLYVGYVHGCLSPNDNFGIFVSHNLGWSEAEGDYYQSFRNIAAYYHDDYTDRMLSNAIRTDVVYTHGINDKLALGASFNFIWSNSTETVNYDTVDTNMALAALAGGRNLEYIHKYNKFYLGGTVGLAYVPIRNLELDFAIEAGGSFGRRDYEESLYNYARTNDQRLMDTDGKLSGWLIRGEVDGSLWLSRKVSLPFSVSYKYEYAKEGYDGWGDIYNGAAWALYYKSNDKDSHSHTVYAGMGLNYFPTGSAADWYLSFWTYYKYYRGKIDTTTYSDETLAGFNVAWSDSESIYNNHTAGLYAGVTVPLMDTLKLTCGLNYYYTFINSDQSDTSFTTGGGGTLSWTDYSGDGYNQYLGAKIGLKYTPMDNLTLGLVGNIPIINNESMTDLSGLNSLGFMYPDPVYSSSMRRDYSVILTLTYEFGCPKPVPPMKREEPKIEPKLEPMTKN